ncbi:uncharacterized protein BP5553_06473 [Venustampulla echinocandica]|uniref:Uncharacterized protein n=1 Tax=Venustampulla echinocandica TaxID=2656787 RepID=A0A370TK06_9HELO|nr:uncharacterized protein BP5553_06473 [Venustampulla echinocandica]RDL35861.1 hypothetical protein BP5553_06473 [Venustampulla echinocandica]
MDAPEDDRDVLLQRSSAELLADLESSLKPFLWKTTVSGKVQIRRGVRIRETNRLVDLLERFQELPQLLDPHLDKIIPSLSEAFLTYLRWASRPKHAPAISAPPLMSLSSAICKLLYAFCKIRGEKVIVRFLSTETRYLELLLSAVESGNPVEEEPAQASGTWSWEERYIALLWLSQLLLAPFDLASISSSDNIDEDLTRIPGFIWPGNVPGVALRVIPLAIRYLSSAGKERDAAKTLLVRVAMRRDMQELGLLQSLVSWAISRFQAAPDVVKPAHYYIGLLSFLAGVLVSSAGSTAMYNYLGDIFHLVQQISAEGSPVFRSIHDSAVARKTTIKIYRAITTLDLRSNPDMAAMERVESTIGILIEYLSDLATPVRLAASKALSIIILKLDPDMANEVVEAIVGNLERGVSWPDTGRQANKGNHTAFDLSNANALEWHGLILTLSHLLYRRSLPASRLSPILPYLAIGLSFEQRSTLGASLGTSVRDAACFGIWALARRYTTAELGSVTIKTASLSGSFTVNSLQRNPILDSPALQGLATELVVSACLDSAGNIRRGASAALQELVGRHPDMIIQGIQLVQVVDYHAIALRSRAVQQVAVQAAQLSELYFNGILFCLLGWRGVRDNDPSVRRMIAAACGSIVWGNLQLDDLGAIPYEELQRIISYLAARLERLPLREIDEAHGLLLCLSSTITGLHPYLHAPNMKSAVQHGHRDFEGLVKALISQVHSIFDSCMETQRRKEFLAEAVGRLMIAIYPILCADLAFRWFRTLKEDPLRAPKPAVISDRSLPLPENCDTMDMDKTVTQLLRTPVLTNGALDLDPIVFLSSMQSVSEAGFSLDDRIISTMKNLLNAFLEFKRKETIDAVSEAAANFTFLLDRNDRSSIILEWIQAATAKAESGRSGVGKAYLHTLFKTFPLAIDCSPNSSGLQKEILEHIQWRWDLGHHIETRTTILACLARSAALLTHAHRFLNIITDGLDDYTTDNRGDIGSLVRIEALGAVGALARAFDLFEDANFEKFRCLFGRLLRLGTEKLDKVRAEAQVSITYTLRNRERDTFKSMPPTSQQYFRYLLELPKHSWAQYTARYDELWLIDLLEGYVLSADTGSQDLVRTSRAALVQFCDEQSPLGNAETVCTALFQVLKNNISNDRVLVPTLEVISFLFDMDIIQKTPLKWRSLYALTQKAHFKTSNVRKLEAAVKVYGGLMEVYPEAVQKLSSMLLHPFPRIRNLVAEELFVGKGVGKKVNWTKASKGDLVKLQKELGMDAPAARS